MAAEVAEDRPCTHSTSLGYFVDRDFKSTLNEKHPGGTLDALNSHMLLLLSQ
jgi:hypothetical protein